MQSVLLTTPTKQANSKESLVEAPAVEENTEGEAQSQEKNVTAKFSDVLDSALTDQNKNKLESNAEALLTAESDDLDVGELNAEELALLETDQENSEGDQVDAEELDLLATDQEELESDKVGVRKFENTKAEVEKVDDSKVDIEKAESSADDAEKVTTSKVDSEKIANSTVDAEKVTSSKIDAEKLTPIAKDATVADIELKNVAQQNTDKISAVDVPQVEQIKKSQVEATSFIYKQSAQEKNINTAESELTSEEIGIDKKSESQAILMQIESAKKVNTKVIETEGNAKLKVENGALLSVANSSEEKTLAKEKSLLLTGELPKVAEDEGLKAEVKPPMLEKMINGLVTGKSEASQPLLNSQLDNNSSVANSSSARLDKLLNTNIQNSNQATQLQQPLELQAKNAPALLGSRILMMINQGKQEVSIRLDPAELGSMNIKLQMQQDQVQLTIQTQAGVSREIIEQNLPRLREQLNQQGINLGEANVEQQGQQQKQSQQEKNNVQNVLSGVKNEPLNAELGDQSEWLSSKIPHLAQGIDYYA